MCSCLVLAVEADGKKIETIEGMAKAPSFIPCSASFWSSTAAMRICTPGVLIAARALLEHNPDPTETEARYWLAGNLCRCTGYDKIIRAVLSAAAEIEEHEHVDDPRKARL